MSHGHQVSAGSDVPEGDASWRVVDTPIAPRYEFAVDDVASRTGIISRVSPIIVTKSSRNARHH